MIRFLTTCGLVGVLLAPWMPCTAQMAKGLVVTTIHGEVEDPLTERVCIRFSAHAPPQLQRIEGDHPRLFLDIRDVAGVDAPPSIEFGGTMIERVRSRFYSEEHRARIVLDLKPGMNYRVEQFYVTDANIFCIRVIPEDDNE